VPETKVVDLKKPNKMVFKSFSFETSKVEKFLVYREVPRIFGNCKTIVDIS